MLHLENRVALVVGGSQSLGRSIAVEFARNGARVGVCSRAAPQPPAAIQQITDAGGEGIWLPGDMRDPASMQEVVSRIVARFGRLDVLVVSGAPEGVRPDLFIDMDPGQYMKTMESQFISRLTCLRAALPHMIEQGYGKIVFVTSDAGRIPTPGESLVGAAAAALIFFVKAAGKELAAKGIRINGLATTLVSGTPIHEGAMRFGPDHVLSKAFAKIDALTPFRMNTPEDLARAALFLAGTDSDQISGTVISINGGLSFH